MIGLATAFIELFKPAKYNKRLGIFENGDENNYPELVESRILESVTAKRCVETMATYLAGRGFGDDLNNIIVNEKKEITLLKFLQDVAESIAEQNGFYIHVNYDANLDHSSFEVIPFTHCRIGKKDDDKYSGKIHVCTDWSDDKLAQNAKKIDVYNTKKNVLQAQIDNAGGIKKYNGQILYFRFGKYIYPYSKLHPVRFDADSEKNASIYKSSGLQNGFSGKTVVITKPLVDPLLSENEADYIKQDGAREKFRKVLRNFLGPRNNDGVIHIEMEFDSDDIDKEIVFKNVDTNLNDELFKHTEDTSSENICIAFGINPNLIRPTNSGLFSQSGEAFRQMKIDYQEDTTDLRLVLEQIINKLMGRFSTPMEGLKIIPRIFVETQKEIDNDSETD